MNFNKDSYSIYCCEYKEYVEWEEKRNEQRYQSTLSHIAAMKINAIVNDGRRIKDFIDIHYLLQEFDYEDTLDFYCSKYPDVNQFMARNSLLYHKDIDFSVPVILKDKSLKWQNVSNTITDAINEYDRMQQKPGFNRDGDDNSEDIERGRGGYRR